MTDFGAMGAHPCPLCNSADSLEYETDPAYGRARILTCPCEGDDAIVVWCTTTMRDLIETWNDAVDDWLDARGPEEEEER